MLLGCFCKSSESEDRACRALDKAVRVSVVIERYNLAARRFGGQSVVGKKQVLQEKQLWYGEMTPL